MTVYRKDVIAISADIVRGRVFLLLLPSRRGKGWRRILGEMCGIGKAVGLYLTVLMGVFLEI